MNKQIPELRAVKSEPVNENWSEIDRLMLGPVDPITKTNQRLSVANIALTAAVTLSLVANAWQFYQASTRPVRVLNINEAGLVESLSLRLSGFSLHRTETQAALRNAVTAWAEKFYSRIRNPLTGEVASRAYPDSFLFLSSELASAYRQFEERERAVSAFMAGSDPEYKVAVTNVSFRNLEKKPYEADVYFDKLYYSQPLIVSVKKSYVATIRFSVNPSDEEIEKLRKRAGADVDLILKTNPLVLAVTQIGDEQPFSNQTPKGE